MKTLSLNIKGVLFAFTGFACLCLGDAFVKKNSLDYDIIYAAFFTNIACIITLLIISIFNGGPKNFIKTNCLRLHLFRGALMLSVYFAFLYAISRMPIAQMYTIAFSQPFILAILAYFLIGEKISLHRWLAIGLGFIGVVIAFKPEVGAVNTTALVALLCAFLFASVNITVKFMDKSDHWMTYIFYTMLVQTPIIGAVLLYNNGLTAGLPDLKNIPWFAVGGAAYAAGLALLPLSLKLIDASIVGSIQYTGLIWGSLLGFIIFREIPTFTTIIGALIIVISGIYLIYRERKDAKAHA